MAEKLLDAMVLRALALKLCENEADAHVDARHPCASRARELLRCSRLMAPRTSSLRLLGR